MAQDARILPDMLHWRFTTFYALLVGLFAALVCLTPHSAAAQSAKEQAKLHYAKGQEYFDAGRFVEAEAAFQRAYDASPHPIVLLSIAESRVGQGNFEGAVSAFEQYLRDNPGATDKAKIEGRITEIKAKPGKLAIRSAPVGATVTIDGKSVAGVTPTTAELEPGVHELVLSLDGYQDMTKRIDVVYGSNEVVEFNLSPIEEDTVSDLESAIQDDTDIEVEAETESGASSDLPVGALVAGGVGAAGLISGIVFGVLALDAESDFDANPTADTADKGEAYALVADISYGVAIAGAATAIILWVTHDSSDESIEAEKDVEVEDEWAQVSVSPVLSPNYAGINTALQF